MRMPTALFILACLATSLPCAAQDLQFRMRTTVTMPTAGAGMPDMPPMTFSIKGDRFRLDQAMETPMGSMSTSMLVDSTKTVMLMHSERSYMEMPSPLAALKSLPPRPDTGKTALDAPEIIVTGEKAVIAGYPVERKLNVMRMPAGMSWPGEGKPSVIVQEVWVTTDTALAAAYRHYAERFARLNSLSQPVLDALDPSEFALRMTMLTLAGPVDADIDAAAILKQENPPGLLMRMQMEVTDVKLGPLPDSLFTVPADYRKGMR